MNVTLGATSQHGSDIVDDVGIAAWPVISCDLV